MSPEEELNLRTLLGLYFGQDFASVGPTWEPILVKFIENHSTEDVRSTSVGLNELAEGHAGDSELEQAVYHDLGCAYNPAPDGLTLRAWLERMRSILRQAAP